MEELKTVFITKYAITAGIQERKMEIKKSSFGINQYYARHNNISSIFSIGKEAFFSKEDAIKDANKRIAKKILSLEKQITKLKSTKF